LEAAVLSEYLPGVRCVVETVSEGDSWLFRLLGCRNYFPFPFIGEVKVHAPSSYARFNRF
jgi:hypothetical protein